MMGFPMEHRSLPQADHDPRVSAAALTQSRPARSIAIASGKGGVGKTWFAISLAASLARRGLRVLLVDGDFGLANVDVQLGVSLGKDLGSIVDDGATLGEAVTTYAPGNFDILAGRAGSGALSALPGSAAERLLLVLSEPSIYDIVLLDLGAGVDRTIRRMTCWADTLLVLATDEPTSLTDAYVVLKLHIQDKQLLDMAADLPAIDARIVVNQAGSAVSGEQTYQTLSRVCGSYLGLTPSLGGVIRRDERVRDAIRSQTPLPLRYPVCPASLDLERIAETLAAEGRTIARP